MKYVFFLLSIALILSCSQQYRFSKNRATFDASKITMSFKSVADMNDAYFVIKENNYFEFYRELFDSIKNTRYPGKYELHNDTLHLQFFKPKGSRLLGKKAVIDSARNQILFFK